MGVAPALGFPTGLRDGAPTHLPKKARRLVDEEKPDLVLLTWYSLESTASI